MCVAASELRGDVGSIGRHQRRYRDRHDVNGVSKMMFFRLLPENAPQCRFRQSSGDEVVGDSGWVTVDLAFDWRMTLGKSILGGPGFAEFGFC